MAERFGSQVHPNGGLRFGSQEYVALEGVVAGVVQATETGSDIFAADSYARIVGTVAASESGSDTFASVGLSDLTHTMQAVESPTPDAFLAFGTIVNGSLRFGASEHPSGGVRFGSQSWAPLGPSGAFAASESGSDVFAAAGFLLAVPYTFSAFDVVASFVDYSSESLGAAIDGTLETGYKLLLPVSRPGITFTWEVNASGNPSLRLAQLVGVSAIADVPWYIWDGSSWTAATFSLTDALQGAVFMVETGLDVISIVESVTRFGSIALTEGDPDVMQVVGGVSVAGSLAATDAGADTFAATGAPLYIGVLAATEAATPDVLAALGVVPVAGALAATEAGADTLSANGRLVSTGAMAATESGADSLASIGRVSVSAVFAATESATLDTASVSGSLLVSGAMNAIEQSADTAEVIGELARLAVVAAVESGADVFESDGTVAVSGTLDVTDQLDTFTCFGVRESNGEVVAAELAAIEGGSDRFVARGRIGIIVPIPTFDGPVVTGSSTRVVAVRSRRTSEAA